MLDSNAHGVAHAGAACETHPSSNHNRTKRGEARRANRAEARALTDDPLLTAQEAAAEAGVALSTWWKWVKLGRFPAPSYPLPRCPRWRRSDVRAALAASHS